MKDTACQHSHRIQHVGRELILYAALNIEPHHAMVRVIH